MTRRSGAMTLFISNMMAHAAMTGAIGIARVGGGERSPQAGAQTEGGYAGESMVRPRQRFKTS